MLSVCTTHTLLICPGTIRDRLWPADPDALIQADELAVPAILSHAGPIREAVSSGLLLAAGAECGCGGEGRGGVDMDPQRARARFGEHLIP